MNKLITLGILAGGGLIAYRAFQLNALAGNITTRITGVRVHQLNLSGLMIAVGVAINNPTKSTVTISKPVVVLTSKGQYVGESDAEEKAFKVAAQKVSSIGDILIKIPLTSAMTIFKGINLTGLFAAFQGQSLLTAAQAAMSQIKVPVEAQISFYADSLFVKLHLIKTLLLQKLSDNFYKNNPVKFRIPPVTSFKFIAQYCISKPYYSKPILKYYCLFRQYTYYHKQ